jgi:antitoxin (DNA-binding transcriptional repressor) of toxin-antitoxin stability system
MVVTMKKNRTARSRHVSAARFKAECLGLLDHVAEARATYVVTKRGRAVAEVRPVTAERRSLAGSVTFLGDIVGPVLGPWDADA